VVANGAKTLVRRNKHEMDKRMKVMEKVFSKLSNKSTPHPNQMQKDPHALLDKTSGS
jgi:hypothetical protein